MLSSNQYKTSFEFIEQSWTSINSNLIKKDGLFLKNKILRINKELDTRFLGLKLKINIKMHGLS